MGDIVSISKPDPDLVQMLEEMLMQARSGELTSIAAVILRNEKIDFAIQTPNFTTLEMLGALELLKAEMINSDD